METFKTSCPACARRLKAPEAMIGQRLRCPACGHTFVLDLVGPAGVPPAAHPAGRRPRSRRQRVGALAMTYAVLSVGFVGVAGGVLWSVTRPGPEETVGRQESKVVDVARAPAQPEPKAEPEPAPVAPRSAPPKTPTPNIESVAKESPPPPTEAVETETVAPADLSGGAVALAVQPVAEAVDPIEKTLRSVLLVKTDTGLGTGFVYHAPNLVITNFHVIAGAKEATAVFFDGTKSRVLGFRLVAVDYDFAVLEIEKPHEDAVPLKPCAKMPARGSDVYALGSPQGLAGTVTKGIVSAYRTWPEIVTLLAGSEPSEDPMFAKDSHWVQTSAPISSGNSGGPLITPDGEVVAINTWVLTTGQNLNFSLDFAPVAKAVDRDLRPRQPLAALPKKRGGFGGGASEEEKVAVKAFWTGLSKILTTFRHDLETGPPRIEGQAGVQAFHTRAEWTLEVLRTASTSLEQLPTEDIPEPVLKFALSIASRMRRFRDTCTKLMEADEANHDRRSAYRLAQDVDSLNRLAREMYVLIHELAPKMKHELERVLGAELPPLMGYDNP